MMENGIAQIRLNKPQAKAMRLLSDNTTRFILFGGAAGGGKSWIGCTWLFMMARVYPGTRWAMCRAELKRLRLTTLQTFFKVLAFHGIRPDDELRHNQQDNILIFNNGSVIDLIDLKYEPSDPFYQRLGSYEWTGAFIDEAGDGIDSLSFDIIKSRLGRGLNDKYNLLPKILLTCNPTKNWIYQLFYKPSTEGTLPNGYAFVPSFLSDNEHFVGTEYRLSLESMTSEVQKDRLLRGNWEYSEEVSGLISYDAILDAFSGPVGTKVKPGKAVLTCDVARYGSDSTVIILWNGLRAERVLQFHDLAITETAEKIRQLKAQHNVPVSSIVIDQDGVGGGVCDLLPGAVNFTNNGRPLPQKNKDQNFGNLKSQCYFKLAELINEREIFIGCDNPSLKEKMVQELEQIKQKDADADGKLSVVSKKDVKASIGRSPDFADCLMMRMFLELRPQIGPTIFNPGVNYDRPAANGRTIDSIIMMDPVSFEKARKEQPNGKFLDHY